MSYWSEVASPSSRPFGSAPPRHLLAQERDKAEKAAKERGERFDVETDEPETQRMEDNADKDEVHDQ